MPSVVVNSATPQHEQHQLQRAVASVLQSANRIGSAMLFAIGHLYLDFSYKMYYYNAVKPRDEDPQIYHRRTKILVGAHKCQQRFSIE